MLSKEEVIYEFAKQLNPTISKEKLIEQTLFFIFKRFKLNGCLFGQLRYGDASNNKKELKFADDYAVFYFNKKPKMQEIKLIKMIIDIAENFFVYCESFQNSKNFATTDRLTGLYNKAYFMGILKNIKNRNERFCLAMLDLDNFKKFNDRFGHQQGDLLLKELGQIIRENIKHGEFACRYGGEEFCIVFKSNIKEAYLRVDMLRKRIASINGIVTASIGLVASSNEPFYVLVKNADSLMYKAKKSGKNRVALMGEKRPFLSRLLPRIWR